MCARYVKPREPPPPPPPAKKYTPSNNRKVCEVGETQRVSPLNI